MRGRRVVAAGLLAAVACGGSGAVSEAVGGVMEGAGGAISDAGRTFEAAGAGLKDAGRAEAQDGSTSTRGGLKIVRFEAECEPEEIRSGDMFRRVWFATWDAGRDVADATSVSGWLCGALDTGGAFGLESLDCATTPVSFEGHTVSVRCASESNGIEKSGYRSAQVVLTFAGE